MTPLIAVAASNDEVPELSDDAKLADLMNRLVEYESFTEEEKQMVDKAAAFCECLSVCDCEPEHECWPSGTYYESNHPHRQYYWGCDDWSCNYSSIKYYTGHNGYSGSCSICNPPHSHSWYNSGSPSPTHTSSGHAQTQTCSCGQTKTIYVPLSTCAICYPPHIHSWQNDGNPYPSHNYSYSTQGAHLQWLICSCGVVSTTHVKVIGCSRCYMTQNQASIRFLIDNAAYAHFNQIYEFNDTSSNALLPFSSMWNIAWTRYVTKSSSSLPYDTCELEYGEACDDTCNTDCGEHHKNATKNLDWMLNNLSTEDFYFAITGTPICAEDSENNNAHTLYGGMAYLGWEYATAMTLSNNLVWSTRAIQHELAHNFGCVEYECSGERPCIMGAGLNTCDDWSVLDIWCNSCKADFNRNFYK